MMSRDYITASSHFRSAEVHQDITIAKETLRKKNGIIETIIQNVDRGVANSLLFARLFEKERGPKAYFCA